MAITPTISFRGLRSTASQSKKNVGAIQTSLTSNIKQKRNLYSSINLIKKRRDDRTKRNLLQTKLFAVNAVTTRGGPKSLATTTQEGLSIGDRLIGFVKYASAGWILSNLPTWMAIGNQFIGRLNIARNILSNYGDETLKVVSGITNTFNAALSNISRFDFLDSSSLLKNSFGDLMKNVDELGQGIQDAFNVIIQPFTNIPPLGSDQLERERQEQERRQETPGQTQPQPPSTPSSNNPDFWTLVAIVGLEDSDPQGRADVAQSIYNRFASGIFPGGKNIKNIILAEDGNQYQPVERAVKEFRQIKDRETAIRAVMVADKHSRQTAEKIIDNTFAAITNPTLQRNAASFVENRTDFLGKGLYPDRQSTTKLRRRNPDDNIFGTFVGPGSQAEGRKNKGASPIPNFGLSSSPSPSSPTPPPQQRNLPVNAPQFDPNKRYREGDVLTRSIGRGVKYVEIGDTIGAGRKHGGIDIFSPHGTYIALRLDCEVVFAGWQNPNNYREGYGRVIDVWVPDLGVQLRFAHCAGFLVTSGKIKAGRSFARVGETGNARGAHIHFEYSTKKGSLVANRKDPSPYIPYILLTNTPNSLSQPSPAQQSRPSVPLVPAPATTTVQEQQAEIDSARQQGISEGITQEREGRRIVVIDDTSSPTVQQVVSGGGGGITFSVNESTLLNNFIRNKLLLDLNYV